MSSSIRSLIYAGSSQHIGTIAAVLGGGLYRVYENGRPLVVKGAVPSLAIGSRILFAKTADGNIFMSASGLNEGDVETVQLDV